MEDRIFGTINAYSQEEMKSLMNAVSVSWALSCFDNYLKNIEKHSDDPFVDVSDIREKFFEIFGEYMI